METNESEPPMKIEMALDDVKTGAIQSAPGISREETLLLSLWHPVGRGRERVLGWNGERGKSERHDKREAVAGKTREARVAKGATMTDGCVVAMRIL